MVTAPLIARPRPATTARTHTVASGQTAAAMPATMTTAPTTKEGQRGPGAPSRTAISARPPTISDTPMRTPRIQMAAKGLASRTRPRMTRATPTTMSRVPVDRSTPSYSAGRGGGGIWVPRTRKRPSLVGRPPPASRAGWARHVTRSGESPGDSTFRRWRGRPRSSGAGTRPTSPAWWGAAPDPRPRPALTAVEPDALTDLSDDLVRRGRPPSVLGPGGGGGRTCS